MLKFFQKRRRQQIKERPFPEAWRDLLERDPHYLRLGYEDRRELRGHLQVLLAEKRFEGCNGLQITDEMRLTVAVQGGLLLLHRPHHYFPSVSSIVLYPGEYVAPWQDLDESGIMQEGEELRSGEFCDSGALVLSWDDVLMAGVDGEGAYNVVIHEFAHQVDAEAGITDGDGFVHPHMKGVLVREFHRLQHAAAHRRPSLLDHYGADSPAEFFAVATECFFENPQSLKIHHGALYEALGGFYCQDPADWPGW